MKQIETKRLYLKEYDEKYAGKAHDNFFCEEETAKYTLWKPTANEEEAKQKLDRWTKVSKISIFWLIHDKISDEPIGFICSHEISPKVYGNLGIAIGLNYIKKGYGSEALEALINYIKELGGEKIEYSHFEENEASKALALKHGFEFVKKQNSVRNHDKLEFIEVCYVLNLNK